MRSSQRGCTLTVWFFSTSLTNPWKRGRTKLYLI